MENMIIMVFIVPEELLVVSGSNVRGVVVVTGTVLDVIATELVVDISTDVVLVMLLTKIASVVNVSLVNVSLTNVSLVNVSLANT